MGVSSLSELSSILQKHAFKSRIKFNFSLCILIVCRLNCVALGYASAPTSHRLFAANLSQRVQPSTSHSSQNSRSLLPFGMTCRAWQSF